MASACVWGFSGVGGAVAFENGGVLGTDFQKWGLVSWWIEQSWINVWKEGLETAGLHLKMESYKLGTECKMEISRTVEVK